jgi:hypothetical protein
MQPRDEEEDEGKAARQVLRQSRIRTLMKNSSHRDLLFPLCSHIAVAE